MNHSLFKDNYQAEVCILKPSELPYLDNIFEHIKHTKSSVSSYWIS